MNKDSKHSTEAQNYATNILEYAFAQDFGGLRTMKDDLKREELSQFLFHRALTNYSNMKVFQQVFPGESKADETAVDINSLVGNKDSE